MGDTQADLALALDFGGTKLTAGLVEIATGCVIDRERHSTDPARGADHSLALMLESGRALLGRAAAPVRGAGISFGGPLAPDRLSILQSMHVPGWAGMHLPERVSEALGLPVVMDNDANVAALGSWHYGAGRGAQHMVYIQVSTGVGAGLVLDGRLYRGAGLAGEFGHVTVLPDGPRCSCGKQGCVESLSAGWAIARDGREALASAPQDSPLHRLCEGRADKVTARLVIEAARQGDAQAQAIIGRAFTCLGIAISIVINLLHPEVIVIGGGIAHAADMLLPPVLAAAGRHALEPLAGSVRIMPFILGDDVTLAGAAALVAADLSSGRG
ncbi:MAG: ROK family protein [Anaerolineae bacterium]